MILLTNILHPSVKIILCFWVLLSTSLPSVQFSSVAQSCPTLRRHESQHARPPCPSPTPGAYTNSCPSSRWYHPAISSSIVPFSSCPQYIPASGSFPMSQLFSWGGQNIWVSALASVLPKNTQDWSPSEWTHYFMANRLGNSVRLYFFGLQNHCRWWLQPWN